MRNFIDNLGHAWSLDLTAGHLLGIQSEMGINLADEPETIPDSLMKMVGILWITCQDEAKGINVTPQEFGKRLSGKVLQDAWEKWMQEYTDFFVHLSPARGQLMRGMWEKAKELERARAILIEKACSSSSLDLPGLSE
jgi:hypothetical protein